MELNSKINYNNNENLEEEKHVLDNCLFDDEEIKSFIEKIFRMVDQTKYLKDEFLNNKKISLKSQMECLETFSSIEKALEEYIENIDPKFISDIKKDNIRIEIYEKLRENYISFCKENNELVKTMERSILEEFSIFCIKLSSIKNLETYFGIKLLYSKLEPENNNNYELFNNLNLMMNDLFIYFKISIETIFDMERIPLFLLYQIKNMIKEMLINIWQVEYAIPMKKLSVKNNHSYIFLSSKFYDLFNDKINFFDFEIFCEEERLLLFEIFFYSNIQFILLRDTIYETFINNLQKYLFLMGIYHKLNDISILIDKFIIKRDEYRNQISKFYNLIYKLKKKNY